MIGMEDRQQLPSSAFMLAPRVDPPPDYGYMLA
jgi:hypothetical protein